MQQPETSTTPRGISNDQTASKAGRARAKLQELLPVGAAVTAIQVNSYLSSNGNRIYEFYLLTTDPKRGDIVLITSYLRALGFGVNRKRGTIRSTERIYGLLDLIGTRIHGNPAAFELVDIDPALP